MAAVVVVLLRPPRPPPRLGAGARPAAGRGRRQPRSTGCSATPGPFRGHVVDFLALPNWPVFNVADMCINVAARAPRDPAAARHPPRRLPSRGAGAATRHELETDDEQRTLQVPEGLDGERVDVGLARMFGISRSKAAELLARGLVRSTARAAAKSDRLVPGVAARRHLPAGGRPARGAGRDRRGHHDHPRRRGHRRGGQAGRGRRPPLHGLDRSDRRRSPARLPATGSRPAGRRSGRASSSGSTSARRA